MSSCSEKAAFVRLCWISYVYARDWAAEAMAWAVENGIITGTDSTSLSPQGGATRAQCAAMLMRCIENVL